MCLCFYGLYAIATWKLSIKSLLLKGINVLPSFTSFLRFQKDELMEAAVASMLFRAPLHFYASEKICKGLQDHLCQCSSELHFISTDVFKKIESTFACVNALPSSTSFLRRRSHSRHQARTLCQCSSELHFISTVKICLKFYQVLGVNALPSSTSFLPRPVRNP